MPTTLQVETRQSVAHVRLARPDALNAMNRPFWVEIGETFAALDRDPAVRAVVLSAEGRHFTAGLDLADFAGVLTPQAVASGRGRERLRRLVLEMQDSFNAVARCRVPVLAAVQGACVGGGVDLVSACDMRYCTRDAFFSVQEINLAITADIGTLHRLPRLIPDGLARELAYTGRRLPAEEARACGLVNAVHADAGEMMAAVEPIARAIAARSPLAMLGTKEMLNETREHGVADGLRYVAAWNAAMLDPDDLVRAAAARKDPDGAAYEDLAPPPEALSREG